MGFCSNFAFSDTQLWLHEMFWRACVENPRSCGCTQKCATAIIRAPCSFIISIFLLQNWCLIGSFQETSTGFCYAIRQPISEGTHGRRDAALNHSKRSQDSDLPIDGHMVNLYLGEYSNIVILYYTGGVGYKRPRGSGYKRQHLSKNY